MKLFNIAKKVLLLGLIVVFVGVLPAITAFAEEVLEDPYIPDPQPVETEPVYTEPIETEPVYTEPIETEPVYTEPIETEPVYTEPVETEPEQTNSPQTTSPEQVNNVEIPTYDVNQLPTLVDSTQVAEELPKAIGADADSGGVSYVGGIVCWIAVGISVAVIFAFLISTKGRSKAGIGRYESGNKLGGNRYKDNLRY